MDKVIPLLKRKKSTKEVISLLKEILLETQSERNYPITGVAVACVYSNGVTEARRTGGDLHLLSGALSQLIYSISKEVDEETSCLLDDD